ncbi:hypothetical protein EG834_01820 [bacterium]|nr:hypothetical protein [bacterium]
MDTASFDYLLRLAALAIAFVGFATIVVTLRRGLGGELSPFHILLVRIYVETGLIVAIGALLPSLLNLFGINGVVIWKICSAIAGVVTPAFLVVYIRRRASVERTRIPLRVYVRYTLSIVAVFALWLNVAGIGFASTGGPYAAALTWFLFSAGIVFVQTLDEVLYRKDKS